MKNILILGMGITLLAASSCKKGCTDPLANNYDARAKKENNTCEYDVDPLGDSSVVNFMIHHMAGANSFAFNTTYVDGSGNDFQFTRAEMYISNPLFKDDNMATIHNPRAYMLISPDEMTYAVGNIPSNQHVHMMDISYGVDSSTTILDPAVLGLEYPDLGYQSPTMHWNWTSGYIYSAFEGVVDIDGNGTYDAGETFLFHVGTKNMYRTAIGLMAHFNPVAGQTHTIHLEMDWAGMLSGIDLSTDNSTHTMDNVPLAAAVADNFASSITMQ